MSAIKKLSYEFEKLDKLEKRAYVLAFGHARDRAALGVLSKWLSQPKPANPDSPSNPPASYWKEKYGEWTYIRNQVQWAVWSITGELLEDKESVDEWIEEQKKKRR